ncbi:uncharacterized protein MELLADRAFT_94698 [Melampsora larici-populina 98AG31]|uniref:Uncharacterized protein n=1 Tax=Melampsora larici-populina (strain 98AG31 / pathotype 3-4-7) TaxID=747676 RepID=F4S7M6_MELLP|nr:uncharacterized protein MELLADRAFT_94698 [Melampsora larici-populina 98AG31]EGF99347.1 hypothetical protein MELLADRAFT_94698 [Melampsora larici-populina 98AG31]
MLLMDLIQCEEANFIKDCANSNLSVVLVQTGQRKLIRIILLAGSDWIQTMSEPGLWAEEDVSLG